MAADTIVLISRMWSSERLQEILLVELDKKVYEFLLDRIDDVKYDPMDNIIKIRKDESRQVYEENDFVKEIIDKDNEFRKKFFDEIQGGSLVSLD